VGDFILGVVVNVLRHVGIELLGSSTPTRWADPSAK
jgi:hypothetical protein